MSVSSKHTTIIAVILTVLAVAAVFILFFASANDNRFTFRFLGNPVKLRFYGEHNAKDLGLPREEVAKLEKDIAQNADVMKGVDVRVTKINSYDKINDRTRIMVSIKVRTQKGTIFSPAPEVMLRKDLIRKLAEMIQDQAQDVRTVAGHEQYKERNLQKVLTD